MIAPSLLGKGRPIDLLGLARFGFSCDSPQICRDWNALFEAGKAMRLSCIAVQPQCFGGNDDRVEFFS